MYFEKIGYKYRAIEIDRGWGREENYMDKFIFSYVNEDREGIFRDLHRMKLRALWNFCRVIRNIIVY